MVGGGSAGSSGQPRPATSGKSYGREVLESAGDAERLFAIGTDSLSILIQANPDNSDNIFIGWDDEVDSNTGIILEPGDVIGMDLDVENQNVWAVSAAANDDLRFMVMG